MTGNLKGALLAIAIVAAAGCGGDKKTAAPAPAAGGGDGKAAAPAPAGGGGKYDAAKSTASVTLNVKWAGAKPEAKKLLITGDAYCDSQHGAAPAMDERYTIGDGGALPHTFVWAHEGPHKLLTGYPEPLQFTLDQKGCMYVPHVFGLRAGQSFSIKNSDGTKHNVHSRPKTNKDFNVAQDPAGTNSFVFATKERAIPFTCDIHSWMSATAFVLDHPFFGVTDAKGSVQIKGLPAGTYTFKLWHEGFVPARPEITDDVGVTVKDGEAATKDHELK